MRIDDPSEMNVLGLFLAARLRAYDGECSLRGALKVDVDGMSATVSFEDDGATVTRKPMAAKSTLQAPLHTVVAALVRPSLANLWRVRVRGSRLFALRALRYLKP